MKKLFILCVIFFLASCVFNTKHNDAKRVHVFALMGQSNMVGVPDQKYLTMPIDSRIKMLTIDDRITQAKYDMYNDVSIHSDYMESNGIGSGISFANALLTYYDRDDEILLIPCARGGSSMYEQLDQNVKSIFGIVYPNSLLDTCISRINNVLNTVEFSVYDGTLYYQGETDALIGNVEDHWKSGILTIRETMRQQFGTSNFVFAQLSIIVGNDDTQQKWNEFKNQQYMFSLQSKIPMITTDDLSMFDGIHINADSQQIVGERFAKAYISAFGIDK